MAKFKELNDDLNKILLEMIKSQELCKYVYYSSTDPLSEPDISDTSSLIMTKIYPVPKIPDTSETTGSYISVIFDDIRMGNNIGYKNSVISFNIISHLSEWKLDGMLRPYAIMNKIDELFNNQRVVGIGKMQFDKSRFYTFGGQYYGYRLDYRIYDFN